jgi:hypothetical protein
MKTRFAAAAAVLPAAALLLTAPGAEAAVGDTVVYTVTSDGPLASVLYDDATTGQTVTLTDQTAPWSLTFTVKNASQMLSVTASTKAKSASCQISVNGTVKDTQSSKQYSEGVSMVQCSFLPT